MTSEKTENNLPNFDQPFLDQLDDLLTWRRDVRHFKTDPLPDGLLEELLDRASLAPSVGNSQPWRFVQVESAESRAKIIQNFEKANRQALSAYAGEDAELYASLKLAGLKDAPVHMAFFVDTEPEQGKGLGRQTMPEMLHYSVVGLINSLWLVARARGVGMGWVSILDPEDVCRTLEVPDDWDLVGYMCIGYPASEDDIPELVRKGWQERVVDNQQILKR